jgi:hypothetical protein
LDFGRRASDLRLLARVFGWRPGLSWIMVKRFGLVNNGELASEAAREHPANNA